MTPQRLLLVCLLAAVATVSVAKSSKDVIVGARQPGDRLSGREFVAKESQWMQIVKLQQTFGVDHGKITFIQLLDQNQKGNGATASIIAGGLGQAYITVQFQSVRSHSIHYIVELYTK